MKAPDVARLATTRETSRALFQLWPLNVSVCAALKKCKLDSVAQGMCHMLLKGCVT